MKDKLIANKLFKEDGSIETPEFIQLIKAATKHLARTIMR